MADRNTTPWHIGGAKALVLLWALSGITAAHAARKNDCLGCHSVAIKLVGPAYKEVAAKYAGLADAVDQLQTSIRNGSVGKWGEAPMPPHPKLSVTDLKKLATWIMGLNKS